MSINWIAGGRSWLARAPTRASAARYGDSGGCPANRRQLQSNAAGARRFTLDEILYSPGSEKSIAALERASVTLRPALSQHARCNGGAAPETREASEQRARSEREANEKRTRSEQALGTRPARPRRAAHRAAQRTGERRCIEIAAHLRAPHHARRDEFRRGERRPRWRMRPRAQDLTLNSSGNFTPQSFGRWRRKRSR